MSHDVPLTVELFPGGGEEEFEIDSAREIYFILRDLAKHGERVALYYDRRKEVFTTSVVDADEDGFWLDCTQSRQENQRIAASEGIVFVSSHHHAKVQFEVENLELADYEGLDTFYAALPDSLLRIQRRDFYRLYLPSGALKCTVIFPPAKAGDPPRERVLLVRDISQGGVALYCEEVDPDFQAGKVIPNCTLHLGPEVEITFSLQVRYVVVTHLQSGGGKGCAGCRFVGLNNRMNAQLQRFITQQQKAAML